jgi:DNA-directed RNA polymerase specialized sigma24 family protein
MSTHPQEKARHRDSPFPATRWTLVRRAQAGTEAEARAALEEICRSYWYPLYAYARRYGFSAEDAEDVTQMFFQNLVIHESIQAAQMEKGTLRSFMLAMLKRIISKQLRHDAAGKRGGSRAATISLDDTDAEGRYQHEPADIRDADTLFDRAWARGVLAAAEEKLRQDFLKANNLERYHQLREFLPLGENVTPYPEDAKKLGLAEGTLRLQVHRMRKRYGKLIEEEIAQTVSTPAEVKAELAHLMKVIGR